MKTVSGSRLSDEAIQRTFAKHDLNEDGKLDLKEMTGLIKEKYNN